LKLREETEMPTKKAAAAPALPPEVVRWVREESGAQKARYAAIVKAMDALEKKRDRWIKAFHGRIQLRGWSYSGGIRFKIAPKDIPTAPRRKYRVVF
jgi:hypothetical protein